MTKKYFIFLILLLVQPVVLSQQIRDLIKPINLMAGEPDTILVSDIFYAEKYNLNFSENDDVSVNYIDSTRQIVLTPVSGFDGISLVEFELDGENYVIPVKSKIKQQLKFSYRPTVKPKKITLFGNFNGWNRDNLPMTDKNNNGTYSTEIYLDPGIYEYKFFVDGEEVVDPENPVKRPNGLGSFNSIIEVKPADTVKTYLHIISKEKTADNKLKINFLYEEEGNPVELSKENIIAVSGNQKVEADQIITDGDTFSILTDIPNNDELSFLRTAVNHNGHTSNLQTVFFNEGKETTPYDYIIYAVLVDRFSDGDSSNSIPVVHPELKDKANYMGGDLQGILDKIEEGYFNKLGVNTLWIFPVFDNTNKAYQEYPEPHRYFSGYHGYWPISFERVEEKFGDMGLFKKLVKAAHQKGLKVLLDYVANHIHIEHPYWKEHRDWFGNLELPDGTRNLRMWDEHRLTTWFEPFMPSFDYQNSEEALDTMTNNAVWWLEETGLDGFRHDAVKHIPNNFWRTLTRKIKKEFSGKKRIFQIGETFGSYKLVSSYVNNGQLDAQFNFLLYDIAVPTFVDESNSFTSLDKEMHSTFEVYGTNHQMGNMMDSHDKVRFMAFADGDVPLSGENSVEIGWNNPPEVDSFSSYEKLKLYMAYMLTIPGIPVVYYGDEIGMTGANDPDNRRMMRFGNQLSDAENETLNDVEQIIKLRNEHTALRYGDYLTLHADDNSYIYLRSDINERILVALNKSSEQKEMKIELPPFYNIKKAINLLTEDRFNVNDNSLTLSIPSTSFLILKIE